MNKTQLAEKQKTKLQMKKEYELNKRRKFYKLITSSTYSDDLFFGFDRSRNRRKDELAQNKNVKGKYQVRNKLKDVIGFAECQEKATYGLGYKLTLTRNKDDAVIDKAGGIADARIKIDHFHWYVPRYTRCV